MCACVTSSGQGSCQKHSQENINLEKVSVLSKVSIGSIGREREEGEGIIGGELAACSTQLSSSALDSERASQI